MGNSIIKVDHLVKRYGTNYALDDVSFEIGEGEIVGDSSIGANPVCADAGIATVLIRSTKKAGEIKIKARMYWEQHLGGAIKPDEIVITSVSE